MKTHLTFPDPRTLFSSEGRMPSLDGATDWLNSPPLMTEGLRGNVVLVNFWTYTCINWLRQLPYVRAWSQKYKDQGLVVVGVHTPEFSFEHNVDNARRAALAMRVEYPVAIDNDYAVWDAFSNQYWPALYFVDADGRIRHHHFGEGAYDESERVLQRLLGEAGATNIATDLVTPDASGPEIPADWEDLGSSENYVGAARTTNFASPGGQLRGGSRRYTVPAQMNINHWALNGDWTVQNEAVVSNEANSSIAYQFHARDLHLVMGPATPGTSVEFQVMLDGRPPHGANGADIDDEGYGVLSEQRLHQLIRQSTGVTDRRFEIKFHDAGAAAYSFTFG